MLPNGWRHHVSVPKHPLVPTGVITFDVADGDFQPDGGQGNFKGDFTAEQAVVPLPPSLSLLLLGFAGLGLARRTRAA